MKMICASWRAERCQAPGDQSWEYINLRIISCPTHGQNLLSVTSCAPLLLPAYHLLPFYSMINLTWYVSLPPLSLYPPRAHTVFFPACFTTSELYSSDHLHSPSSTPTDPLSARPFSTNLFITFPPSTYGINCLQDSWASNDCFSNVEQITITKIYRA